MDEPNNRLTKAMNFLRAAQSDVPNRLWDPAVGRSYYCAFTAGVAFLIHRGVSPGPGGRWSHGWVQIYDFCAAACGP